MYVISKGLSFDAAHSLPNMPEGHQCARMHGHTYGVELTIQCSTLERGMVIDYGMLSGHIKEKYDHRTLNDLMDDGLPPTAECLAEQLWSELQTLCSTQRPGTDILVNRVTVHETTSSSATFIPGGE